MRSRTISCDNDQCKTYEVAYEPSVLRTEGWISVVFHGTSVTHDFCSADCYAQALAARLPKESSESP